jgi:GNAT superfamily N-acetyltransferase
LFRAGVRHLRIIAFFIRRGAGGQIWREIRHRVASRQEYQVLALELSRPLHVPAARIPLRLRTLQAADVQVLLDLHAPGIAGPDLRARISRRRLLQQGIGECFVAVGEGDRPCFMQWLFLPVDNEALRRFSGGFFAPMGDGEAILEGTFTLESARGQGVMTWAQTEIARLAQERGARRLITYVAGDNAAALLGCERSGFLPWKRLRERWFLFRCTIERLPGSSAPSDRTRRVGVGHN